MCLCQSVSLQGAAGELRRSGPIIHSSFATFPVKGWLLSQMSSGYEGDIAWQECFPGKTEEGGVVQN